MISSPKQRGFSLPEVIVAISVITMVIFSATNLVVTIIRSNADNIDTLTAYGLAQEGIEGMRNVRDSNWLLGASFIGDIGSANSLSAWGDGIYLPMSAGETEFYSIDLNEMQTNRCSGDGSCFVKERADVRSNAPWELSSLGGSEPAVDSDDIRIFTYEDGSDIRFAHHVGGNPSAEETKFHRYIKVENISDSLAEAPNAYRVSSIVTWSAFGRDRSVELVTDLTDWNKGQL